MGSVSLCLLPESLYLPGLSQACSKNCGGGGASLKCGCLCCLSWRILGPWQCCGQPWPIQQQTFVKQRPSGKREVCLPRAGPRQGLWLPSHTTNLAICSIRGPYCPHLFAQSENICGAPTECCPRCCKLHQHLDTNTRPEGRSRPGILAESGGCEFQDLPGLYETVLEVNKKS